MAVAVRAAGYLPALCGVPAGHIWSRQLYRNTFPTASILALKTVRSNGPSSSLGTRDNHHFTSLTHALQTQCCISSPSNSMGQQHRSYSFFTKLTADELWKGALAETGAGARKGRGKRTKKKRKKDLNRGQIIGEGRRGFLWPGLNVPLMREGAVQPIAQRSKEDQEKVEADMVQQREEWDRKRKTKVKRERGWSGNTWGGVSLGPPDPGPSGGSRVPVLLPFVTERVPVVLEFLNFIYCLFRLPFRKKDLSIIEITSHYYSVVFYGTLEAHNQEVFHTQEAKYWLLASLRVASQSLECGSMHLGSIQAQVGCSSPNTIAHGVPVEQRGLGVLF